MMQNELREKRTKRYVFMRSLLDYGMGLLYLAAAVFMFFADKLGVSLGFDLSFQYIFGGLCAVYGLWRVYRGYKKEYY